MLFPIGSIGLCEFWSMGDDQQVFGIAALCALCKVERASNYLVPINHHDLVVGDLVS